jgi:hypothetical protein
VTFLGPGGPQIFVHGSPPLLEPGPTSVCWLTETTVKTKCVHPARHFLMSLSKTSKEYGILTNTLIRP